jgi:hypothetical protein
MGTEACVLTSKLARDGSRRRPYGFCLFAPGGRSPTSRK